MLVGQVSYLLIQRMVVQSSVLEVCTVANLTLTFYCFGRSIFASWPCSTYNTLEEQSFFGVLFKCISYDCCSENAFPIHYI